jgi:hypothetical protein
MIAKETERLAAIVSIWKKWRNELVNADVRPIGEEPSGCALTGFAAETDDAVHIILLREVTDQNTFSFSIGTKLGSPDLLASNTEVETHVENGILTATLSAPRSYAWLRLTRKI